MSIKISADCCLTVLWKSEILPNKNNQVQFRNMMRQHRGDRNEYNIRFNKTILDGEIVHLSLQLLHSDGHSVDHLLQLCIGKCKEEE
jgi:hypothetical protein